MLSVFKYRLWFEFWISVIILIHSALVNFKWLIISRLSYNLLVGMLHQAILWNFSLNNNFLFNLQLLIWLYLIVVYGIIKWAGNWRLWVDVVNEVVLHCEIVLIFIQLIKLLLFKKLGASWTFCMFLLQFKQFWTLDYHSFFL